MKKISRERLVEIIDDEYNSLNTTAVMDLKDAAFTIREYGQDFSTNRRIQKLLKHSYDILMEAITSIERLEN